MGSLDTRADNNQFLNNNVNITGTYFATGIIAGDESYNTVMKDNTINLNADDFAYGLTFEESQKTVADSNKITADASAIYLMELFQSNGNTIVNNELNGNGSYTYGIVGSQSSNNLISGNTIYAYGDDNGDSPVILSHTDLISPGTSGVSFVFESLNNNITDNTIVTNAVYAVNLTNTDAFVYDNKLKSASYSGDDAVYPNSDKVFNNTGVNDKGVNIVIEDLVKVYNTDSMLTGSLTDSMGNPIIGHHVSVTLTRVSSGASKTYDVVTDYTGTFTLPINLAVGTYTANASYAGTPMYDAGKSNVASIVVVKEVSNKTVTVLSANKFYEPFGAGKSFTGTLMDLNGSPVIGHHVSVTLTRVSSGASKTYDVVVDYTGTFALAINLARGEYTGLCSYAGTSVYEASSAFNTISVY